MPTPFERNGGLSSAPAVLDRDVDMLDLPDFILRTLTPDDAAIVARHRAAMFHEMGNLAASEVEAMEAAAADYLRPAIERGEYHGWLALQTDESASASELIVGGAGIQLRPQLPRPKQGGGLVRGHQGIILNVYVEPAFRRRGLARALVDAAIAWARQNRLAGLVLHASEAGRPLYAKMGFVETNEMRFTGSLTPDDDGS
jgi:GNAT superfamily N-acetyltransferase